MWWNIIKLCYPFNFVEEIADRITLFRKNKKKIYEHPFWVNIAMAHIQFEIPSVVRMFYEWLDPATLAVWSVHTDEIVRHAIQDRCKNRVFFPLAVRWSDAPTVFPIYHVHRPAPACLWQCFGKWHADIHASTQVRIWYRVWCASVWEMSICPIHQRPIAIILPANSQGQEKRVSRHIRVM